MCSLLQFAAFFYVCCLIRDVATHAKQNEERKLSKQSVNPTKPGVEDFYFFEETENDNNVKTGRPIPESSWSKEDNEQNLAVENKTGTRLSDELSITNILSYLLNVVQELKKDIFGIKETASFKITKESENSKDNFEDKGKQNKPEENLDEPKSAYSIVNSDFKKEDQQTKSNYLTDYYQKNNITFIDDEENDDDSENFSDTSDDSSHQPNEEAIKYEVRTNNENTRTFKISEVKRNPDIYMVETEKITLIPASQIETPQDNATQTHSQVSKEKTVNETSSPPSSKIENSMKKEENYFNNINERKVLAEKTLNSAEFVVISNTHKENSDQEESERSNQDKTTIYKHPGKNSKNIDSMDFGSESGVLIQSTTLSPQSLTDVTLPEDGNEHKASKTSLENLTNQKEQNPNDQKKTQNEAKSLKNSDEKNGLNAVTLQSHKAVNEVLNPNISTEINDNSKESKGKTISSLSTVTDYKKESNLKTDRKKTSNGLDIVNTIEPTNSENVENTNKLSEDTSDSLSDKKETNKTDRSEKPSDNRKDKIDSENQKIVDNLETENSSRNKSVYYSYDENNGYEGGDTLVTTITNKLPSSDSFQEIQNHKIKGSVKSQEFEESNQNFTESAVMEEDSPDQEYEYGEDSEDYDVSDEIYDTQDSNQYEEEELNSNNEDRGEDSGEINSANITVLTNEPQMSQHMGYVKQENSQRQYNTFLEYFYENSNSPYFQSLKNQSNNLPLKDEH